MSAILTAGKKIPFGKSSGKHRYATLKLSECEQMDDGSKRNLFISQQKEYR